MNENEQNLLAEYRRLHDMLSDMIEGGRLTAVDIPDDYDALVRKLTDIAGMPAAGGLGD